MAKKQSTFEKHCAVIEEWLINGENGAKAYKKFYPKSTITAAANSFKEIHRNPHILEFIKSKKKEAKELADYSRRDSIDSDRNLINQFEELKEEILEMDQQTFLTMGDMYALKLRMFSTGMLNGAKERLNKICGHYEEHNRQKGGEIEEVDFSKLSTKEIKAYLAIKRKANVTRSK